MESTYILYSRYEDGSLPVQIKEKGEGKRKRYELKIGEFVYNSVKDFLKQSKSKAATTFFNYFRVNTKTDMTIYRILENIKTYKETCAACNADNSELVVDDESVTSPSNTGIDIVKKKKDIEKIFYAYYAKRAVSEGLSVEDLLQEVFKGLLVRNKGKGAWNPSRGSFGSYVHMVAGSVYKNFRKKEIKRGMKEKAEIPKNYTENSTEDSDYSNEEMIMSDFKKWIKTKRGMGDSVVSIVELLSSGKKKKEIAEELGINSTSLHKAIDGLKLKINEFLSLK
jgi:DNA-directed RNA polymerase specialized sigma24 family protein